VDECPAVTRTERLKKKKKKRRIKKSTGFNHYINDDFTVSSVNPFRTDYSLNVLLIDNDSSCLRRSCRVAGRNVHLSDCRQGNPIEPVTRESRLIINA